MRIFKYLMPIALCVALSGCWEVSNGSKIGMITRLNKEGAFIGTWEAQIIRGGMSNGSGVFGNAFAFTIESNKLAERVQEAMDKQQEVKIYYHKEWITAPWRTQDKKEDSNVFLDKIEIISPRTDK